LPSTCFSVVLASCAGLPRTNSGSLLLRDSSATRRPGAHRRRSRPPGEAAVPARCGRRGLLPVTAPSPCCRHCLRARPRHLRTHRLRNNGLRRYGVRKYRLRRQSGRRACGGPAAPEPRAPGRGPGPAEVPAPGARGAADLAGSDH
jgi:hypothetical protein